MTKEQSPNNNTKSSLSSAVLEGFQREEPDEDIIPKEKLEEWLNS